VYDEESYDIDQHGKEFDMYSGKIENIFLKQVEDMGDD